jgi:hypothetical protein
MSSSNPSDPRLLLPDWLRDGDVLLPVSDSLKPAEQPVVVVAVAEAAAVVPDKPAVVPVRPYSERLSLDTRLDPGALVSAEDLPTWLGGLDRSTAHVPSTPASAPIAAATAVVIEEPEPHEGVDAPEDGVIDVEVNGWYMIAGAIALLILLAAALRLYLS